MREIIVTEFISLDGVVEAPGGEENYRHTGWTFDIETDETMYACTVPGDPAGRGLVLGKATFEQLRMASPERERQT